MIEQRISRAIHAIRLLIEQTDMPRVEMAASRRRLMMADGECIHLNLRHFEVAGLALGAVADCARLPLPTASVSTVVASFMFCSIADSRSIALEIRRVLRPNGTFLSLEHCKSKIALGIVAQKFWQGCFMKPLNKCNLLNDPVPRLIESGLLLDAELAFTGFLEPLYVRRFINK